MEEAHEANEGPGGGTSRVEPSESGTPPTPDETGGSGGVTRHEDVVERIRELLGKYPTLKSRQLYDLAVRMHPDIEKAGFRSFHARYVLPLKRAQARAEARESGARPAKKPARSGRKPRKPAAAAGAAAPDGGRNDAAIRARVREVLHRLAREVAAAETRAGLVDALTGIEGMVDEVVRATRPDRGSETD